MTIPTQAGKVSLDRLGDISKIEWGSQTDLPMDRNALLTCEDNGFRYDFLWSPKPGAQRLFVMFSGDALRAKNDPPVFQRWSWAEHFPGHCLYISDPSLYLDTELGAAWYAGTQDYDPMPFIAQKLQAVLAQFDLTAQDLVAYGSSGGGYATLRLLLFMPDITSVAVNPQISTMDYEVRRVVNRYLRVCFGGMGPSKAKEKYAERLNLLASAEKLKNTSIILVQNDLDTHHYEEHYKPFCAALGEGHDHAPTKMGMRRVIFSNAGGHTKAEDAATFELVINLVIPVHNSPG